MRYLDKIILIILMLVCAVIGNAQSDELKFEIGAQATGMSGGPSIGGGIRIGYNINRNTAVEGEVNIFARSNFQGQFGIKSGWRFNKIGIFGKVRPGFIHTKDLNYYYFNCPACILQLPSLQNGNTNITTVYPALTMIYPIKVRDTHFSLDVGGVVEFYPTKRFFVRIDAGDTIGKKHFYDSVKHGLQLSTGVGLRF